MSPCKDPSRGVLRPGAATWLKHSALKWWYIGARVTDCRLSCLLAWFTGSAGYSAGSWPHARCGPPERHTGPCEHGCLTLMSVCLHGSQVETIGDSYMAATGLMSPDPDHAITALHFTLAMRDAASEVMLPTTGQPLKVRIGERMHLHAPASDSPCNL